MFLGRKEGGSVFCKKEIHGQTGLKRELGAKRVCQGECQEMSWKNGMGRGLDWP